MTDTDDTDEDRGPAMLAAVSVIRAEHRAFATALNALERYLEPVLAHRLQPNHDLFGTILTYIDTFTDRFHHPKEDEHLFRALRARTDRADAALLDLQHEHVTSPAMLREVLESLRRTRGGSATDVAAFARLLQGYNASQVAHMRKENEIVIPIAREALSRADWETVGAAFRDHRDPLFGTGPDGSMGYLFRQAQNVPDP